MEDMSASSETILEGLDDAQMSAVTALDGPVRIIAGAGAGKTRTVTRRIAYACARGDWNARKVLAVTFSVKAAAEMRARLQTLGVGDDVTAATFHSAALQQQYRNQLVSEKQTESFQKTYKIWSDKFDVKVSKALLAAN